LTIDDLIIIEMKERIFEDRIGRISRAAADKVQGQMAVSQPGEVHEQEAEAVSEKVMRLGDLEIQRHAAPEEEELQARQDGSSERNREVAPWVEKALRQSKGKGSPVPDPVRTSMESRFGADFSPVRLHTGGEADKMNRAVSAEAFTHGKDIFFREGRFRPGTKAGDKLLAHELTHVIQQSGGIDRMAVIHNPQDDNEKQAAQTAYDTAAKMTDKAQKYIGGDKRDKYKKWFDKNYDPKVKDSKERFEYVKWGWVKIHSVFKSKNVGLECSTRSLDAFASVNIADSKYYIKLRKKFWNASLTGIDSRAGTIIHELSHEEMYTDDHVYGKAKALNLAENKPDEAAENADNWEYFAEDIYS
jgi:hypothetical protein